MDNKTKILGAGTILLGTGFCLLSFARPSLSFSPSGTSFPRGLEADESNAPKIASGSGKYVLYTLEGNPITFAYDSALTEKADGVHVALNAGGTLTNETKISGIGKVNFRFSGALEVFGRGSETMEWTALGNLVSGSEMTFAKTWDYISLKAAARTEIRSFDLRHSCLSRFAEEAPVRYEAERMLHRHNGWNYDNVYSKDGNASNGEYIGNVWSTLTLQFDHYAFRSGEYTMRLRYGTGDAAHTFNYSVNGRENRNVAWGAAPGWGAENFRNKEIRITLKEGWNHLEFGCNDGNYLQLDYVEIVPKSGFIIDPEAMKLGASYFVEAENCENWDATQDAWGEGQLSMGVGAGFGDSANAGFTLRPYAMETGNYRLKVRYWNNNEAKTVKLGVNGGERKTVTLPATSPWAEASFEVTLKEGANTIEFATGGSWCNFDYFALEKIA